MVQIYYNELAYPALMKQHNRLLLSHSTTNGKVQKAAAKSSTLCQELLAYGKGYFDVSNVHCFSYLTNPKRRKFERVIWLLLLIATTSSCIYVYEEITDLYYSQRLVTVVADSLAPIYIVPFPSIGICPRNRINWPRLLEAHNNFLSPNASDEAIKTFRQFFGFLGNIRFSRFFHLKPLTEADWNLALLDDVNIRKVFEYVSFTCNEMFEHPCYWRQQAYNCCDIFTVRRTETGFCMMFNSLVADEDRERQKKDRYYPYRTSDIAEGSGLDVTVKLDESKEPPEFGEINGVYVMVKQPELWNGISRFIGPNTYTKIAAVPQSTLTDERTRTISPEERKCLFEDESWHPLYKNLVGVHYRRGNCYSRCRQDYVFNTCKCNLDLFFPYDNNDNITMACRAKDFKCFYEYRNLFGFEHHIADKESEFVESKANLNESMICNCYSNCNHLIYDATYISEPLNNIDNANPVKKVRLDVHYTSTYIKAYRTGMRYTFVELLANFGGIFGLFLGASLMSLVELVYYFTIGLHTHLHERGYTFNGWFSLPERTFKVENWKRGKNKQRRLFTKTANKNRIFI